MEDILYDFNEKVISLMTDFLKNLISFLKSTFRKSGF